jgi:hypothetical protein
MPILGWAIVAGFAAVLTLLIIKRDRECKAEESARAAAKATH